LRFFPDYRCRLFYNGGMEADFICQGRRVSAAELDWLRSTVATQQGWSRKRLARELCQRWQWRTAQGRLKDFAARSLLLKLKARGLLSLPPLRQNYRTRRWELPPTLGEAPRVCAPRQAALADLQPLRALRLCPGSPEAGRLHEPQAKSNLLEIEQAVEVQAREWHQQRLQKRRQQVADDQGAVCPQSGAPLQEARYETVRLNPCAGTVTIRAPYGRHPRTGKWQHPIRLLWGLKPRQMLSPQLEDRVSYTAVETDSYERAAKMATQWGTPLAAATIHKHAQQMGREAAAQTKVREQQLMAAATQAQAVAPLPNGLEVFCLVETLLHQLKHGQEANVLETLEALPAQRQAAGLSLSDLLQRDSAYFQTHREHLHYQELAAKGSPIGTGAMESTCGQLQTRVKRTGQFWKPTGLANMLALKAALQNEDWPALGSRN
jgi:hypothetical protein